MFRCAPHGWLRTGLRLRRTASHACVLAWPYLRAIRDFESPRGEYGNGPLEAGRFIYLVAPRGLEPLLPP